MNKGKCQNLGDIVHWRPPLQILGGRVPPSPKVHASAWTQQTSVQLRLVHICAVKSCFVKHVRSVDQGNDVKLRRRTDNNLHALRMSRGRCAMFYPDPQAWTAFSDLDCLLGLYWTALTPLNGYPFLVYFLFIFFYFGSCGTKLA